jgi:cyclopropane fatty-acyl-phospholipid synthase-like methyltransferase
MEVANLTHTNQIGFTKVNKCRLCGSSDLNVVFKLPDTPFGDRYLPPGKGANQANLLPLEIIRCGACWNFQTSVVPDLRGMYEHYLSRPGAVNQTLSAAYSEYAENLGAILSLSSDDLVVEIGSNDGFFASHFAQSGVKCIGIDPAQNLSQVALDRGVKTISSFFTSDVAEGLINQYGQAKLVVANMVVANVFDLGDFFTGVKKVLAPNGIYAMETNYVLDVVENLQLEVVNHEHITYFSVTSLSNFLQNYGLEVFYSRRVPAKSGALRCYIKHVGADFEVHKSVAEAISFESQSGIFLDSAWKPMSMTIEHVRHVASNYFRSKQPSGVVGYGTSIGATTIIYALEIGGFIESLVDDDPYRQGLESPGWAIPTASKNEVFNKPKQPQFCAVLAPRYVGSIVEKSKDLIANGVTFVRVWPSLEELPNKHWSIERPRN